MVSAAIRKISSRGNHSNRGLRSAVLRAKKASPQKKMKWTATRNTPRSR